MTNHAWAPWCAALLAGVTLGAQAVPVTFTSVQYNTSTAAIAGTAADAQFGDSGSLPLPLTTSAVAVDGGDFAAGGAIAAQGLLSTSAEASNTNSFANATSAAGFVGSFQGGGIFTFQFSYASQDLAGPPLASGSSLSFMLQSNGGTLLSTLVPVTEFFSVSMFIPTGGAHTVSLLLSSEATVLASLAGSAQNTASVSFQVSQVPEPTTWLLMLAGALLLVWQVRRGAP